MKNKLEKLTKEFKKDFDEFGLRLILRNSNCIQLVGEFPFKLDVTYYFPNKSYKIRWIELSEEYRGNGYSKKLIEVIENVAKKLNMEKGKIYQDINLSFWEHMGYINDEKILK